MILIHITNFCTCLNSVKPMVLRIRNYIFILSRVLEQSLQAGSIDCSKSLKSKIFSKKDILIV